MRWQWLFWWRHPALLRVVIVNMTSDQASAFQGVLWQSRGPWLVLKHASALHEGKPPQVIDGDVVIEREKVAFLQVLP